MWNILHISKLSFYDDDGICINSNLLDKLKEVDFVKDENGRLMYLYYIDYDSISFLFTEPYLLPSGIPSLGKMFPIRSN